MSSCSKNRMQKTEEERKNRQRTRLEVWHGYYLIFFRNSQVESHRHQWQLPCRCSHLGNRPRKKEDEEKKHHLKQRWMRNQLKPLQCLCSHLWNCPWKEDEEKKHHSKQRRGRNHMRLREGTLVGLNGNGSSD